MDWHQSQRYDMLAEMKGGAIIGMFLRSNLRRHVHQVAMNLLLAVCAMMIHSICRAQVLRVNATDAGEFEFRCAKFTGRITVGVHGPNWTFAGISNGEAKHISGDDTSAHFQITVPLPKNCRGEMRIDERARWSNERLDLHYEITFTHDSPTWGSYIIISLPIAQWAGVRCRALRGSYDGKLPRKMGRAFSGICNGLAFEIGGGKWLAMVCDTIDTISIADARHWGGNTFEVRFTLAKRGSFFGGMKVSRRISLAILQEREIDAFVERVAPMIKFERTKPFAIVHENGEITIACSNETLARISIGVHGIGWTFADLSQARNVGISRSANECTIVGEIPVPRTSATMRFRLIARRLENALGLDCEFRFMQAIRLNSYQVSLFVPIERYAGERVAIETPQGRREFTIPERYSGKPFIVSAVAKCIMVAPQRNDGYTIELAEPAEVFVQDNREWGGREIELRFHGARAGDGIQVPAGTTMQRKFTLRVNAGLQVVLSEAEARHQYDTSDWIAFPLPWDDAPVDVSWLNDKPAGKHGFLTVRNGRFIFEDGTPARFWGTCLSATANFPTHEQAERIARRMAKFGVNIVRTHHMDAKWSRINLFDESKGDTRHFDAKALDRLDYFIYCLKREGIYVYLDMLVHRHFTAGDGVDAAEELPPKGGPYALFDRKLIELQKEYCRNLWTHRNPYTGLRYCDDPAIVLCEIVNENDLFSQPIILEPYRTRLERRFKEWAKVHGIPVPDGEVDFNRKEGVIAEFLTDVMREYFEEMYAFLRSIGVKIPITGTNWSRNTSVLMAMENMDFTDSHAYWNHPRRDGSVKNTPLVNAPRTICMWLAFNRVHGKPFFVSEWDEPYPNEWRAELPLHMAYIGALQGWGGLTVYTYRHDIVVPDDRLSGAFETYNDPARFGLFPHAALLFRRGDASPAKESIGIKLPQRDRLLRKPIAPWHVKPLRAVEQHRLFMLLPDAPVKGLTRTVNYSQELVPENAVQIASDTSEYHRSWHERIGAIDTPRTQAVFGFIGGRKIALSAVTFEIETDFATVAVSSLTDAPIHESERLLMTAVGRAENTGTIYNLMHTRLLDSGRAPILIQPIRGVVTIRTRHRNLHCYALDRYGRRVGEVKGERTADGIAIHINDMRTPKLRTMYWVLELERTR